MPKPLCSASTLPAPPPNPTSSCLKIVAVSRKERFVRVLNQSLEETADLGGLVLQQLLNGFPVCMYRFPLGTLLEPRHHVTVRPALPPESLRGLCSSLPHRPSHPDPLCPPGLGRGAQQHQEAAAVVRGPRACPLPLRPGMRDSSPEPQGRGQVTSQPGMRWAESPAGWG